MPSETPFLRVELIGVPLNGGGLGKLVLTRQEPDSVVEIETTHRIIFCPPGEVRAALASIIAPEAERLEGN